MTRQFRGRFNDVNLQKENMQILGKTVRFTFWEKKLITGLFEKVILASLDDTICCLYKPFKVENVLNYKRYTG